jgi:hypothetical protein
VRRTKGVIDIHFSKCCQLTRKSFVVFFFTGVKTEIFEQQYFSRLEFGHQLFDFRADTVWGKRTGIPKCSLSTLTTG